MKGAKERNMCFICTAPSNSATQWTDTFWVPAVSLSVHQVHETQKGNDPGTWFGKKLTDQWILSNFWVLPSCHALFLLLSKPNIWDTLWKAEWKEARVSSGKPVIHLGLPMKHVLKVILVKNTQFSSATSICWQIREGLLKKIGSILKAKLWYQYFLWRYLGIIRVDFTWIGKGIKISRFSQENKVIS